MFLTVLTNVAIMLIYMSLGFLLCKGRKAFADHAKTLSGILIYLLGPMMIVNSFLNLEFSKESFIQIVKYFVASLLVQSLFFAILYLVLHTKYEDSKYRILSIGSVLGNVGFFGMPVIAGIFPNEPIVSVYSSINVLTMNFLVFTIGAFMITNDKKYMSIKSAILNPTTIAIIVALPLYFWNLQLPSLIGEPIWLLAKMVTPVCMLILGIRLASANLKKLFTRPFVYVTCGLKLIAFPLFALLCVKWLPFIDDIAKTTVFVLAATPSGAIIESLAEMYECEQELSANVVLMTTLLTIITMPLILFVFG